MNVQDVKTNLSSLLDRVVAGETIVVSRHNKPIAELRPLPQAAPVRTPGLLKGQVSWHEDAFKPMSDSELADFDSSPLFPALSSSQTSSQ
jgi:antitoxin (DNA-binding transcriptional repressor) of toxin-antitoxin stability system